VAASMGQNTGQDWSQIRGRGVDETTTRSTQVCKGSSESVKKGKVDERKIVPYRGRYWIHTANWGRGVGLMVGGVCKLS